MERETTNEMCHMCDGMGGAPSTNCVGKRGTLCLSLVRDEGNPSALALCVLLCGRPLCPKHTHTHEKKAVKRDTRSVAVCQPKRGEEDSFAKKKKNVRSRPYRITASGLLD